MHSSSTRPDAGYGTSSARLGDPASRSSCGTGGTLLGAGCRVVSTWFSSMRAVRRFRRNLSSWVTEYPSVDRRQFDMLDILLPAGQDLQHQPDAGFVEL